MRALLLPIKDLTNAKKRLIGVLTPGERFGLAQAMLADTMRAVRGVRRADKIFVVTNYLPALRVARENSWETLPEERQISESDSVDAASRICQARGVRAVLRVPLDLPLIQPDDIDDLLALEFESPALVIVPSWDGTGTNAILRTPPTLFPSHFGNGSFAKHLGDGRGRRIRSARLARARLGRDGNSALAGPERRRRSNSFERGNSRQSGCKNLTNGSAMKQKVYPDLDAAVADVPDGARIMFGGFGGAGFPNNLIQALARKGTKNITAISNNCGTREGELGLMFKNNQVKHVIASFPGPHANHFQDRYAAKEVTLELVPQGILCERMRAAAAGLTGFYTTVGVGTEVAAGKEERVIAGERCILEMPIHADYAFIKAQKADALGNLTYRLAARNFNPIMAMAAKTTIVEAEEIVPLGSIDPENVITPAIFVHRIVQAKGLHYAG